MSHLLDTINDWTLALNNRNSVTFANIDFAKAFDRVSHCKLKCKLSGRPQQTRVGSSLSAKTSHNSGAVQGIGPLSFVLFINDITLLYSESTCT